MCGEGEGVIFFLLKTFSVIPEKPHSLLNLRSHVSLVSRKPDWRVDINSHFLGFSSRWEPSHNLETAKKKKSHSDKMSWICIRPSRSNFRISEWQYRDRNYWDLNWCSDISPGPDVPRQFAWGPFARVESCLPKTFARVTFVPPGQMQGATMTLIGDGPTMYDLSPSRSASLNLSPALGDAIRLI